MQFESFRSTNFVSILDISLKKPHSHRRKEYLGFYAEWAGGVRWSVRGSVREREAVRMERGC